MKKPTNLKKLHLTHLYPEQMNVYGDWGNVLTLTQRAKWHGFDIEVHAHHPGKPFPAKTDLVIGGGGQDSGQTIIQHDLLEIGPSIQKLADRKVPMLVVCGLYQLFGHFFETVNGERIKGIGIFDIETYASDKRLIGNVVTDTPFGEMVGYENHSGLTILTDDQRTLGRVVKGAGNNGTDKTEGAIYNYVYGTYLHGSLLPKNPVFADALIEAAAMQRYGTFEPQVIDDSFAEKARAIAIKRPR